MARRVTKKKKSLFEVEPINSAWESSAPRKNDAFLKGIQQDEVIKKGKGKSTKKKGKKKGKNEEEEDKSDTRYMHPISLFEVIAPQVRLALGMKGFMYLEILTHWNEIVGEDLSRMVRPVKINFTKGRRTDGILSVEVITSAHALAVGSQEMIIVEKINRFFGYKALSKVRILHGSLSKVNKHFHQSEHDNSNEQASVRKKTPKEIATLEKIAYIKDDGMRDILTNLYESIQKKKNRNDK